MSNPRETSRQRGNYRGQRGRPPRNRGNHQSVHTASPNIPEHSESSFIRTGRGQGRGRGRARGGIRTISERDRPEGLQGNSFPDVTRPKAEHWQKFEIIHLAKQNSAAVIDRVQNEEEAFFNAFKYDKFLENDFVLKQLIKILFALVNSQEDQFSSKMLSRVLSDCHLFVMKLKALFLTVQPEGELNHFFHIIKIAHFCIERIPQSFILSFPHADLKETVDRLDGSRYRIIKNQFEEYNHDYEIKKTEYFENQRPVKQPSKQRVVEQANLHDVNPPDNYREIEILPQPHEIQNSHNKPFLRPNIVEGTYHNWDHYLDVQFRLLREDFMGPLRDGIHDYLQNINDRPDINVYKGVRVLTPICLFAGIGFLIQFDVKRSGLQNVKWEHSRRLIYGSLLCFSRDNFQTILFASVVNRDQADLKNGQLTVKFEGEANAFEIDPCDEYTMVESTAYFEAYRHVLEGLQQIVQEQMPFRPYIVGGYNPQENIPPPVFLRQNSCFDLNGVLKLKKAKSPIDVTRVDKWPLVKETCLDESQFGAIQTALSQEISIIQGPPGTGKTYIGLKIVQALLLNRSVWDPKCNSPILVVCYTNHALDQFLEGILECQIGTQPPKVVRIGGRCKSDQIKECALKNLVKSMRSEWRVPKNLAAKYKKNRVKMEQYKEFIESRVGNIDSKEGKVLTIEEMKEVIDLHHYSQLNYGFDPDIVMEVWLKLLVIPEEDNLIQDEDVDEDLAIAINESLFIGGPAIKNSNIESNQKGGIVFDDDEEKVLVPEEGFIEVADEPQLLEDDRIEEGEDMEFEMDMNSRRQQERKAKTAPRSKKKITRDGEWQTVQISADERKRRIANSMKHRPLTNKEVAQVVDVWCLDIKRRWRLYLYWLNKHIRQCKANLRDSGFDYDHRSQMCQEINQEINLAAIANSHVVGMTTTGAAKYSYILKHLHPKIVIVEEAAEVLESHIITSLCPSVQQLILIGDHKQLQPKPTYYELEEKYNFHISLFERLAKNGMPVTTLDVQHRMRPEIARIVGNHIYDELKDHPTVEEYDCIKGVGKNLFFIDHDKLENGSLTGDSRSHSNTFEANYVVSLTRYFLKQGYIPSQITILTMYRGQLIEIKQKMGRKEFGGVRVAAVDDFQGEENDIIILSLVRSNKKNIIGFLKVENRVCVSLSRAKKGMYVIGNFSMLRNKEKTKWPAILAELDGKGFVGSGLPLCCQIHPKEVIIAKAPDDFSKCPEGGCLKQCNSRLECGHVCRSPCHPIDREHKKMYKCQQECCKDLPCGHKCRSKCYQCQDGCTPCTTKVPRILEHCGHEVRMKCSTDQSTFECYRKCERLIGCNHQCQNKCFEDCTPTRICQAKVDKKLPCGHVVPTKCSIPVSSLQCPIPCNKILDCLHDCAGTCGKCNMGRLHIPCKHKCDRPLSCGHICKFPCTANCPPCTEQCKNYCFHSRCPKKCYEPCVPCREPCKWQCRHFRCNATCGEMCDRPPCEVPCKENLPCGHQCIGLCGEDCPSLCRICDKEEVCEIFFGTEDEEDACFIQLKDCNHIFEITGMDHWMSQQEKKDAHIVKFIECPKCTTPIRRSLRYGNSIKKTIHDMEEVKRLNMKGTEINITELQSSAESHVTCTKPYKVLNSLALHVLHYLISSAKPNIPPILPHEINTVQNQLAIIPVLVELMKCISSLGTTLCSFGSLHLHASSLTIETEMLIEFLKNTYLTPQQINDIQSEVIRIFCLARICEFKAAILNEGKTLTSSDEQELNALAVLFVEFGIKQPQATEEDQKHVDERINRWKNIYEVGKLTESERLEIIRAMSDIRKGAWFKCPNGHYYCIGDCGGAMEEGKCLECGAHIGGGSHRVRNDNQHASEIDNSHHPAWSEENNMGNYDFD